MYIYIRMYKVLLLAGTRSILFFSLSYIMPLIREGSREMLRPTLL